MSKSIFSSVEDILSIKTPGKPLKILIVGPEVSPYANVGGVSRVLGYLAKTLYKMGHDVRVFMPKFGLIDEETYPMEMVFEGLRVPTGDENKPFLTCNIKRHQAKNFAPVYFLENQEYYEWRANVYGYGDDHIRWALLSRGVLEWLKHSASLPTDKAGLPTDEVGWIPDVIHANDWEGGQLVNWLRTYFAKDNSLLTIATVFTIHNLMYQGLFDHRGISEMNFDDGQSPIASFYSDRLYWQNFTRRGILYSDLITTVSKTYSREILKPDFGEGLDRLLSERRSRLFGVLNGIDYEEFNPKTDKILVSNYDASMLEKRLPNKVALQEEFDLPGDTKIPIIALEGRLTEQKGIDLLFDVLPPLLRDFNLQFIVLGGGEGKYLDFFRWLAQTFPQKVGAHLMYDYTLPRLIFAGADLMLFPSKWEPCGLVQMEGMRYGAIPIARAVGGLADTVLNFNPEEDEGWGFTFKDFDKWAFFAQIIRAMEVYRHKDVWQKIVKRAMSQDWSWGARAQDYLELYEKAIHLRRQDLAEEGRIERPIESEA